jgi:sortase A
MVQVTRSESTASPLWRAWKCRDRRPRDTFFRAQRNVRQDDEITLMTLEDSYPYRMDSIKVVGPEDTQVLDNSGSSILTLVTCFPFYFVGPAPRRFIVRAQRTPQ